MVYSVASALQRSKFRICNPFLLSTTLTFLFFTDLAEAQYVKTSVASFSTSSTTFTNVTGGTLTFTPSTSSDIWILLVNARLMSTQIASFTRSAEARYLVNGVEHGIGGILNSAANKGASWQHFYRVTGTTAMQTVQVQLRDDSAATATIADLQIIAFLLPAGADFQYTETEAIQAVPSPWTTYESLSFTPSAPGTYLIMALANGTEDPGTGGIGIRIEDPSLSFWPDNSAGGRLGHLSNTRIPWRSYFLTRAENLTATPQTYNLQATGDSVSGSQLRYTRLMAFRTDALDNFETAEDTAITSTTSTTPVVRSVLTTVAPPSARDYIVIQSLVLSGTSSLDENRAGFETDDVVKMSYDHVFNGSFHFTSFSFFDALTSSGAVKYENTFSTSNGASAVEAKDSAIHVLRLPPPPVNFRSIGTAADYTVGTVSAINDSAVVTGSGTQTWKTNNRGRGDRITIDGNHYTILSVDSETQLTLTTPFTGISGTSKTYTIVRQFTTLQAWEDCISFAVPCPFFPVSSASLVADNRKEVGIAYQDSVFTITTQVLIDGSTTDATHNIVLTAALGNRHNGTAGTGVVLDGLDNGNRGVRVRDDYTVVEWLELKRFRGANGIESVSVREATNVLLSHLLIHDFYDPVFNLVGVRGALNSAFTLRNSILYDGDSVGVRHATAGTGPATIENCTIYGMENVGIQNSTVAWTVRNTISMGNPGGDFNIVTGTQSYNISSDATAAGTGSLNFRGALNQFVSVTAGSEDLHLKTGADAVDAGVDLSAQFCCDIDWEVRPGGAAWDIGADEFGAVAAGVIGISSAANQSFTVGAPLTAAASITVTDDVEAPAITASGDLRIRIPAGFNMRWNAEVDAVGLTGTAVGKVMPDVVYEDLDRTVVLNVVTDFALGDQIQIDNLQFMSFTAPSLPDSLELEITNDGSVAAVDDKLIEIVPNATPVLSSAYDQIFILSQPPAPAATLFVTEGLTNHIKMADEIIIRIPAAFPMLWDTSITTAIIGGTGSSNVSTTVSYTVDDRGLIVDVTTNFVPGEYISISGLGFTGFTAFAFPDNLQLDVKNAVDTDDKTIEVDAVDDVPFFTATATDSQVELEWVTPDNGTCVEVLIVRVDPPADPTPVSLNIATIPCPGPGIKQSTTDLSPLNDLTYTYGAFVHDGIGTYSKGQRLDARPFDTTGNVKWAYSTAAASMASPGLRFSGGTATVYAVSNDNILHAIQGGAGIDGGTWPVGWIPHRLGGPAQARPPVVAFTVGSATNGVAFLGSQDGKVYAINADDGSKTWSKTIATMVQAAPGGNFVAYDVAAKDLVLVGTRNSAGANALVALNVADGTEMWSFKNLSSQGGDDTDIGIISGAVTVVYATHRLFFASRQKTGGSANTVWCIEFGSGVPNLLWAKPIGNIDGSPTLWGGVLYVGTNAGSLYGLDAATGTNNWPPLALGDGAIKGFVFPQFGSNNRFVSTNGKVWSIADSGASAAVNSGWPVTSTDVPSPSIPTFLWGSSEVFVGSGDGKLYQLDVTAPVPTTSVTLGDGGGAVGAPTVDLLNSMIYVGTEQGVIYGVVFPLP